MRIYKEMPLADFEPWAGAVPIYNRIRNDGKLDDLEAVMTELYPDGVDETMLNDILWFDTDWVYETLGIVDEDYETFD